MKSWRLLRLETQDDSFLKMAKEEAIMDALRAGQVPATLRFYAWSKPAVAIGYFQEVDKELDLSRCRADGVELFRRLTGGGAVYKFPTYELNYSFIIHEDDLRVPKDIEASYKLICGAVMKGLARLGFVTTFKPINDILLDGKKISGNAQTRVDNVLLQHGTILLRPDIKKMFTYLKIDDEKLREKKVAHVSDLVTGLCETRQVSQVEVQDAITEGFRDVFGEEFEEAANLTPAELARAKDLYSKYAGDEWNLWR